MSNKSFEEFIGKFGTPLAILIGAAIIGGSILVSVHPDWIGKQTLSTQTTPSQQNPNAPVVVKNIKTDGLPMLGKSSAPVTMVEFGDFQCPFCGRLFKESLPQIKKDYIDTGKVKFYYNDFAFLGPESIQAAAAAKCADDQGKFWDYHDYIYNHQQGENQGAFSYDNLKKFAGALGLDQNKFNSCVTAKKYEQAVQDETKRGQQYGVKSTPSTFVNGDLVLGAVPYDVLKVKIEEKLKK